MDFDRDVKPLLREKCTGCHGPSQQNGGLRLDRRQSALIGGGNGVAIVPGNSGHITPLMYATLYGEARDVRALLGLGADANARHEAGAASIDDPVYQRGVAHFLKTQREDGSWMVKSRVIPLQVYFDSGFPHGTDQFISAAGTSWAAIALTLAVR